MKSEKWLLSASFFFRNGLIYFPDFCQLVLERFREDKYTEEDFRRSMFKVGQKNKDGKTFNNPPLLPPDAVWNRPLPHRYQSKEIQDQ